MRARAPYIDSTVGNTVDSVLRLGTTVPALSPSPLGCSPALCYVPLPGGVARSDGGCASGKNIGCAYWILACTLPAAPQVSVWCQAGNSDFHP
jgi:hypothetical protein